MSEPFQPGQHPDADKLSAFIDNALPPHERQETLAHLAQCDDCRSVVYLAQDAVLEDQPTLDQVLPVQPKRKLWFSGWTLAWRGAAVFTCLVVAVLYAHHLLVRGGNGASVSVASNSPSHGKSAVGPQPPTQSLPSTDTTRPFDRKASGKAVAVAPEEQKLSSSSFAVHGTTVQTLPLEGRQASELSLLKKTPEPTSSKGAIGTFAAGGRVTANEVPARPEFNASASAVLTRPAAVPPPATSPAPQSAPAQLLTGGPIAIRPAGQLSDRSIVGATSMVTDSSLRQQIPLVVQFQLPSHLPTVSTISNARLILAIDSGGTLFASQDGGEHWKSISPRWTGHAIKVNFAPTGSNGTLEAPAMARMRAANAPPAIAGAQYSIQNIPQAQATTGNASLTGVVTDRTGAVIPNATVVATNTVTAQSITAKTDATGRYGFGNLGPGTYTVTARSPGFRMQTVSGIEMTASQAVVRNIAMDVAAATQTVTVQAESSPIQTESTNLDAPIVDQDEINVHPAVFELITDTGEVWTSSDGQRWKRK